MSKNTGKLYSCDACNSLSPQVVTFIAPKNGRAAAEWDACKDNLNCREKAKQAAREAWKQGRAA